MAQHEDSLGLVAPWHSPTLPASGVGGRGGRASCRQLLLAQPTGTVRLVIPPLSLGLEVCSSSLSRWRGRHRGGCAQGRGWGWL